MTREEIKVAIAGIFNVNPEAVRMDEEGPPWTTGWIDFAENKNAVLTFEALAELADFLGHKGIDVVYDAARYYSEVTPGDPASVSVWFAEPERAEENDAK